MKSGFTAKFILRLVLIYFLTVALLATVFSMMLSHELAGSSGDKSTMVFLFVVLGLVSLGVGIITSWSLLRNSIARPLAQLADRLDKIAQGDLSVSLDSAGEGDGEVGQIQKSVESLVDYLRGLAYSTNMVASGDLDVNIVPRSEGDTFGLALREMASSLRKMVESVRQMGNLVEITGNTVTVAVTRLADMTIHQEASINEQVATSTEISVTCREISATTRELVNTMDRVASEAEATSGLAGQGRGVLNQMQEAMGQTVEGAGDISSKLAILSEEARKIGSVMTTIGKVARQTNLLSLNAAIEAEKAGEYGRGFGVVATEIRRLADQTAVATLDIEGIIHSVQGAINSSVMDLDKFIVGVRHGAEAVGEVVNQLGEIMARVQAMSVSFDQVNSGMKSQVVGADQITESVRQQGEGAAENAASIRAINEVVADLCEVSQGLADAVATQRKASLG